MVDADVQAPDRSQRAIGPINPVVSLEKFIEVLVVPDLSPQVDRQELINQGLGMDDKDLGRGRWLLTMRQFEDFLRKPESCLLVVDGHCQDVSTAYRNSPISVFSASLAALLTQDPSNMVLNFFCGQHNRRADSLHGPRGMMRSIIYQILLYTGQDIEFDLSSVTQDLMEGVSDKDLSALCEVFTQLMEQVQSYSSIYCILDNVCAYETSLYGCSTELVQVFETLREFAVDNSRIRASFKLLLTSTSTSTMISRLIDPSSHLSLVAGNVLDVGKTEAAISRRLEE